MFDFAVQSQHCRNDTSHRYARSTGPDPHLPSRCSCYHRLWDYVCLVRCVIMRRNLTSAVSGSAAVGYTATLGPRFGMRTMVITRYAFGYWGGALVSILNILTQVCPPCPFNPMFVMMSMCTLDHLLYCFPISIRRFLTSVPFTIIARLFRYCCDSRRPGFAQHKFEYAPCCRSDSNRVRDIILCRSSGVSSR